MKTITLALALLSFSFQIFAQSKGTLNTVPFQITLISPLGTNGTNSINTVNKVSLNILGGYHAGLEGAEFGCIANMNRDYMSGLQFAGISNYTGGTTKGAQFAGISNVNRGNVYAFQFAGITNVNLGESSVFQFAGITNVNMKGSQIFQGAGVVNYTMGISNVIQAAGVANYAEELTGAQLAGVSNFALKDVKGAQIAGVLNAGKSINGAQIAGMVNASKYVRGAQIAGMVNVAKNVDGMQIGVINIADTIRNGIPIGVLSIVRDGFHEFEIGFSEGLNTYASFKIGVNQFYNIFSIGTQFLNDKFRWGFGYGIGTHLLQTESYKVNLEAISYQINEGTNWTSAYNGLQQIKLTYAGSINQHTDFFVGPTFNLMVSDYNNSEGNNGSDFAPYHFIDHMSGNTNLKFWVGINAGLRIH